MPDGPASELDSAVRLAVLTRFAETGRAPVADELGAAVDASEPDVVDALYRLERSHDLVLEPDRGTIRMALPFSAAPTSYRVEAADGRAWWANCAWDALRIPILLFRSEEEIDRWAAETGHPRGETATLGELWQLSLPWDVGRLTPAWRPPSVADRRATFAAAGLRGSFWGLSPPG